MGLIDKHYHIIRNVTESVSRHTDVTINEHRAPTDESLKLLLELDKKSKENILFSISNRDNILNGCIICFMKGFGFPDIPGSMGVPNMDTEIHYAFSLNGKDYRGNEVLNYYDPELQKALSSNDGLREFFGKFIAKKLALSITQNLLTEYFKHLNKKDGTI